MSLPRYPEYKPSGVEWLGEVPGHWKMRSLRYAATIQNGSDFKDCEVAEGGYPVLGSGGEFARISKFIYDQPSVLLGRKGTIDNPLYIEEPFWTVDTLFYTKLATDTHPKFFYWFCTSIPFDYFQFGSAVPSMTQNDLYGIKLSTPSFEEQQTIAAFLDRETGKIDALIAEQQRLVELLAEKRQAVISHAVTKGLPLPRHSGAGRNPAEKLVPHSGQSGCPATQEFSNKLDSGLRRNDGVVMKDSGIAWLGEVPAHWEIWKLSQAFDVIGSGTTPKSDSVGYYDNGQTAWVNTGDLNDGELFDCDKQVTDLALSEHSSLKIYPPGTLVIAMYGATIGRLAILHFPATVNQAC